MPADTTGKTYHWHEYLFSAIIAIYCAITVYLFVVVFLSSFKTNSNILEDVWGFPRKFILTNYITLFQEDGFARYILNSVIVTACSLLGVLTIASLVAYGLARFDFRGKQLLLNYFLIGLMLPPQISIVPLFISIRNLGLINRLPGVILIYIASMSLPVFVLANFLKTVPKSLAESAKIDGAGEFTIYWRIMLPLMRPAIGALVPLLSVFLWNDLFIPLVFLTKEAVKTIPLALLKYFYVGEYLDYSRMNMIFAAMAVAVFPIIILYLLGSKHIIGGLMQGATKE